MKTKNQIVNYVQNLLQMNRTSCQILSPPFEEIENIDMELRQTILQIPDIVQKERAFFEQLKTNKLYYVIDIFQCVYFTCRLPDSEDILVGGPVVFESFRGERLQEMLYDLKIPEELHDQIRDYYLDLPFWQTPTLFTSIFSSLADELFGKDQYEIIETDFGELDRWNKYYSHHLRIPDQPFLSVQMIENRYELENRLIDAVSSGNASKVQDILTQCSLLVPPTRLNNKLRDAKDYCITLNTLCRKAAEEASVHPIHIDALSNENIKTIEGLTSLQQCQLFRNNCISSYCRLVRIYTLSQYSPPIQKVLTYISTDLSADLSLKALSELLSVNASYLSTLFKKEKGISLTEYVNQSRIEHAKRLLDCTELPLKSIARQCGYSDVYYFSRLFKKITGTTPKKYREERIQGTHHYQPPVYSQQNSQE